MGPEWIFRRLLGERSGFSWLRIGTSSCEHGDEPSGSGVTESGNNSNPYHIPENTCHNLS
jgi:hypothetical protein